MIEYYGIEAGRTAIIRQIRSVFAAYGLDVEYRHLSLIADFMTQNGTYRPFNRFGMKESDSPFQKMSFETTTAYLTESCLAQNFDNNTTPSASLILGQVPKVGTGTFDLLYDHQQ
jgi:DNA-directed RNA polymerase I subunit RPA1